MSSSNCQLLSTPFCPHPLHPLPICSTHTKFAPPTPNCSARSFSVIFRRLAHVSTLYQYKTKTHTSIIFLIRYSPHPLRSLILHIHSASHSPHHSTHSYIVLDKGGKMHTEQSPYQLHPQQFLSSSSSFAPRVYIMVCFKILCI